ncbi:interphotoreceptor retinoid-binding protein [Actinoplanes cyaneus]|uniref:Interphotoreceptor retinoid-binding protein n=1 Tax=Actinoplanes cyaneus TaxID=52696 RepID=A0A919IDP2_9ACTN|nr:S41 family peptidase [Actinoplanes cyaneus]MCW2142179.1 N-terminal domain of Peptidase_S41 [Actinoplanes cyaneus]GID63663.1 interphotoreceptor retinoid-binding protein [Actinoplanes cyaneus]
MRQDEITQVVTRVKDLVTEHYVFPEVGHQVAAVLEAARYPDGVDAAELATRVTEDLQSVNGDRHLRLLHSEEPLRDDHGDDEADLAELTALAARTGGGIGRVERLDDNIALIEITPLFFPPTAAGDPIAAAMTLAAGASALILDVRRCRGGVPETVALFCSYLFGPEPLELGGLYFRAEDRIRQFWTVPHLAGPRFGPDRPIAVLTSATTFSGGEDLAFTLQERKRATIIGETTRGGAHPREGFAVHPHLEATIPVARSVSPLSGTNWEGTGVRPDLATPATEALPQAITHLRAALL